VPEPGWWSVLHVAVAAAVVWRVLSDHRPPGVSLAWILLVLLVPFLGAAAFLAVGERRLGRRWVRRSAALQPVFRSWVETLPASAVRDPASLGAGSAEVARLARSATGLPVLSGHRLTLFSDSGAILRELARDVDAATRSVHMEFYIWQDGGGVDPLVEALERAARRGVRVRCAMDALGSAEFLKGPTPARMRAAGIEVVVMLPVNAARLLLVRMDLRDHRKIAVVDGRVAWTGSMNVVDPRYFKTGAGVGEWVDAMARVEGPGAWVLDAVSTAMTGLQMAEGDVPSPPEPPGEAPGPGTAALQVFPTGPGATSFHIETVLLQAIYAARRQVVLTTPYFVPGAPLVAAMRAAALRGVEVTLIVPARSDSRLVQHASAAHFEALLSAGVRVLRFGAGLLHTKSAVVDGETAIFGTANLDARSFLLNFEVSLLVYDEAFARDLLALCRAYEARAEPLALARWGARPAWQRLAENAADLAAPLL
jgi:cardiolipin synthase